MNQRNVDGTVALESTDQIFGRMPAVTVVRRLMERPKRGGTPRSLDQPVLVFEGVRGSGKTALLSVLVGLLDQRVPYASFDLEASPRPASVPDVLSALAFELGRRCHRYGELRFPRFIIGRLVIREELDLDNHPRACRQVTELLRKERNVDTLREILQQTAGGLLSAVQQHTGVPLDVLNPAGRHLMGLGLNRVINWAPGRRIVLGSFHDWYGSRGRGLTNDAIDVLVDLNRWGRNPKNEDNRQRIEELLWDAFLTDLREEFRASKHADELALNCVALLDNVDTEIGQRFLHGLVRVRRQRAAEDKLAPDPLTVLTTSRGVALAELSAAGPVAEFSPGSQGIAVLEGHENGPKYWWAKFRLADLTEDETSSMVSALALREGNNERLTRMVHQLTGGHPASTRLLVDAVAERPEHRDNLAVILDQPEPRIGPGRLQVGERMRQQLLMDFPSDVLEDLVTCAAARDPQDGSRLAEDSGLLASGKGSYEVIKEVLWPLADGAGPVLLRRLLLRLLSRRDTTGLPSWSEVFRWLRTDRQQEKDETAELYYALAVRDLASVTAGLRELLARDGLARWHQVLAEVTSAPGRQLAEGAEATAPIEQMRALLDELAQQGKSPEPLSRLIASLWIAGDPLTDSRRASLHRQLDADYRDVARSLPGDVDSLLRAADYHRKQASLWK
jgi:hypothetical protein